MDRVGARGIGAGMAVRRSAILEIGGFDEMLGPGARFPACDEWDVAVRAILEGYYVLETDRVAIVHHGFRSWSEGRELARRDWLGIGAAYAKPLRAGRLAAAGLPFAELRLAVGIVLSSVMRGRPRGVTGVASFLTGLAQGLATPVDRRTLVFRPRAAR
jgi:GT2 family glycosyltransferase